MSRHKELLQELEGYARSADGVESLMGHISRRLHEEMARYNWVGFYLADPSVPKTLVLGAYVGSFVPLERIAFGAGLCGTAAVTRKPVVVNDVGADPRYVNRAEMVKSEMVAPVVLKNELVAEIDVESYFTGTFTKQDQEFVEACAALVSRFMEIRGIAAVKTPAAAR
jgi:putative methionine-R-sulfoxide reductase with GAF domain